jgi:DNA-binding transcriptional regulator/RsmH inhibitor MraZ
LVLSLGAEVECDAQGRIVLPDSVLQQAGLSKDGPREITLVGAQDHLQIFARDAWTSIRNRVLASAEDTEAMVNELRPSLVRENRTSPPPSAT